MPSSTNHQIAVVASQPSVRWQGRAARHLDAERIQLPWEDPVTGGADPFIAVTSQGQICATTSSASKLLKSVDGGQTWADRSIVTDPPFDGLQAFGILNDDTFLLSCEADTRVRVCRSEDLGATWELSPPLDTSPWERGGGGTHGSVLQLPNGTTLLPVTHWGGDVPSALFIHRSEDGGKTWGDRSRVCLWGTEASLLQLQSGRLLIAIRYQGCGAPRWVLPHDPPGWTRDWLEMGLEVKQVYVADSDDEGYTWRNWRRTTTGDFDAPGDLIQLSDGTVVLTYAHRAPDPAPCGTWAMISRDEGCTWERNRYVVNGVCPHSRAFDWGFSASLVLHSDLILTLSGCRGEGWPKRAELNKNNPGRIHVIRWRLA